MRILLAGSGGGHVRQLLDLEQVWIKYPHSFVTEKTALGESLAADNDVDFVSHYAVGQIRLGRSFHFARGTISNFLQSLLIVLRRRPDVIITTGAGAMFWSSVIGKLLGGKLILIDSFARFEAPSKFARATRLLSDITIVQSEKIGAQWPGALVFDPLRVLPDTPPQKEDIIFATVGATLQFPRLVEAVLKLKEGGNVHERVILQVGKGGIPSNIPAGVEVHEELSFARVMEILRSAKIVVTHGGTGSLVTALREGCKVISMPRQYSLGEHYDDHQEEITRAFEARGLIEIAHCASDLAVKLESLRERKGVVATTDASKLVAFLEKTLAGWRPPHATVEMAVEPG